LISVSPFTLIGVYVLVFLIVLYRYEFFKPALRHYEKLRKKHAELTASKWTMPSRLKRKADVIPYSKRLWWAISHNALGCLLYAAYPFISHHLRDDKEDRVYNHDRIWAYMNKQKVVQGKADC
jgi:hypothetical protein